MSNPSKKKGTEAETKVKNYFINNGLKCERKALAGSKDLGDLCLHLPSEGEVTIEVKAGKQTWNYNRAKLNEWKRQTLAEASNSGCPAILVIVRYKRKFADAEVWWPNVNGKYTDWSMEYIDKFVRRVRGSEK